MEKELGQILKSIREQEAKLARQDKAIADQEKRLEEQRSEIVRQRFLIEQLNGNGTVMFGGQGSRPIDLEKLRARGDAPPSAGTAAAAGTPQVPGQQANSQPEAAPETVGQAPEQESSSSLASLPEGSGVMTPEGGLVVDPSIEFSHSSSNRLVFRGVEIVSGIQIGVIEASDADRDAIVGTAAARYGLTNRIEVEARVPTIYRQDRVMTLAQQNNQITRTISLDGGGIGDAEIGARYQINSGRDGWPVFIGGLRAKSDTGTGPFDVDRDTAGVATELATGSGFLGVEPNISVMRVSDPAVLFANASYLVHLPKDIDKTFGNITVGEVDPGDSIGVGLGFGFALNPEFSFSLGYKHNYIFPTKTELNGTIQSSEDLQVGSMLLGMSYRVSDKVTISSNLEFGMTSDSPDTRFTLRVPYQLF